MSEGSSSASPHDGWQPDVPDAARYSPFFDWTQGYPPALNADAVVRTLVAAGVAEAVASEVATRELGWLALVDVRGCEPDDVGGWLTATGQGAASAAYAIDEIVRAACTAVDETGGAGDTESPSDTLPGLLEAFAEMCEWVAPQWADRLAPNGPGRPPRTNDRTTDRENAAGSARPLPHRGQSIEWRDGMPVLNWEAFEAILMVAGLLPEEVEDRFGRLRTILVFPDPGTRYDPDAAADLRLRAGLLADWLREAWGVCRPFSELFDVDEDSLAFVDAEIDWMAGTITSQTERLLDAGATPAVVLRTMPEGWRPSRLPSSRYADWTTGFPPTFDRATAERDLAEILGKDAAVFALHLNRVWEVLGAFRATPYQDVHESFATYAWNDLFKGSLDRRITRYGAHGNLSALRQFGEDVESYFTGMQQVWNEIRQFDVPRDPWPRSARERATVAGGADTGPVTFSVEVELPGGASSRAAPEDARGGTTRPGPSRSRPAALRSLRRNIATTLRPRSRTHGGTPRDRAG